MPSPPHPYVTVSAGKRAVSVIDHTHSEENYTTLVAHTQYHAHLNSMALCAAQSSSASANNRPDPSICTAFAGNI